MKKEKTKLQGLIFLYCVTLVFGLLAAAPRPFALLEALSVFWGTPYFALACFDAVIFLIQVVMYLAMLVLITLRRRAFLICFWIDYLCRVVTLAVILLLGGQLSSSWSALLLPSIWALYFYSSINVAKTFSPYRRPLLRRRTAADAAGMPPDEGAQCAEMPQVTPAAAVPEEGSAEERQESAAKNQAKDDVPKG